MNRLDQPQQGHLRHLPLRDESLDESDDLPDSGVLAQEINDDLETALEQFREFTEELGVSEPEPNR